MKASDLMTRDVLTVAPDVSVREAARLMIRNRISGLPVVGSQGRLVGIVTEGDFLRRAETGTERRRPHWLQFLAEPGALADEYARAHGQRVEDVMTPDPVTVPGSAPLERVAGLMEAHHVKRLPVVDDGRLVGIVSRADLLRAVAYAGAAMPSPAGDDTRIRERILAELSGKPWSPKRLNVVVDKGEVVLSGVVTDERARAAVKVAVADVDGVGSVRDQLVSIDPATGIVFPPPDGAS